LKEKTVRKKKRLADEETIPRYSARGRGIEHPAGPMRHQEVDKLFTDERGKRRQWQTNTGSGALRKKERDLGKGT